MAGYRQFHTKFWKDEWLVELDPLERYLFAYLFTNELSSISGIYKIPKQVIKNETGLQPEFIDMALKKFQDTEKIFYKDSVMWVVNMKEYHKNASPKTMTKVNADVASIGDCDVKKAYQYYERTHKYCIDMVSIQNSESLSGSLNKDKAEDKAEEEAQGAPAASSDPYDLFLALINDHGIPVQTQKDALEITRMLQGGATLDDLRAGIAWKVAHNEDKPIQYVDQLTRPTLMAMKIRKQKINCKGTQASRASDDLDRALAREGLTYDDYVET